MSPLTFRFHRWEYPAGVARLGLSCNRCDGSASLGVEPTNLCEAAHIAASTEHRCRLPVYHWDEWRFAAFERGMDADAACAGRALIREHYQHGWPGAVDEEAMMDRGLRSPKEATERWRRLLDEGNRAELEGRSPCGASLS
jgi:hypothetical protein